MPGFDAAVTADIKPDNHTGCPCFLSFLRDRRFWKERSRPLMHSERFKWNLWIYSIWWHRVMFRTDVSSSTDSGFAYPGHPSCPFLPPSTQEHSCAFEFWAQHVEACCYRKVTSVRMVWRSSVIVTRQQLFISLSLCFLFLLSTPIHIYFTPLLSMVMVWLPCLTPFSYTSFSCPFISDCIWAHI